MGVSPNSCKVEFEVLEAKLVELMARIVPKKSFYPEINPKISPEPQIEELHKISKKLNQKSKYKRWKLDSGQLDLLNTSTSLQERGLASTLHPPSRSGKLEATGLDPLYSNPL